MKSINFCCAYSPVDETAVYDIVLGTNSLDPVSENRQFRGVSEIYLHPQFDFFSQDYDLALLKLSEPVEITDHVRVVCLPTADMMFPPDTVVTATGFGESSSNGMYHDAGLT